MLDLVDDKTNDLYLPRSKVSDIDKIDNIKDIANTCKNYLQACCLISVEIEENKERIYFSDYTNDIVVSNLDIEIVRRGIVVVSGH